MRAFIGALSFVLALCGCAIGPGFDQSDFESRFGPPQAHIVTEPRAPIGEVLRLNDLSEVVGRSDLKDRYFTVDYLAKVKTDYGLGIVVNELRYGPEQVVARQYTCMVGPYVVWYRVPKFCDYKGKDLVAFVRTYMSGRRQ